MAMIISEILLLALSIFLYKITGSLIHTPFHSLIHLGFIVIIAILTGRVFKRMHLPVITGYMIAGLIISPFTFKLSPIEYINDFKLIDYFAITFIGMQAGSEMSMKILRRDFKKIFIIYIHGNFYFTLSEPIS